MNTLQTFTDINFDQEVMNSDLPVFVDFWSTYCSPCKTQMPIVESLQKEYSDKIKFGKIEVGDNPDIPAKLQVFSVPSLAIFHNGRVVEIKSGFQSKETLQSMLDNFLANPTNVTHRNN